MGVNINGRRTLDREGAFPRAAKAFSKPRCIFGRWNSLPAQCRPCKRGALHSLLVIGPTVRRENGIPPGIVDGERRKPVVLKLSCPPIAVGVSRGRKRIFVENRPNISWRMIRERVVTKERKSHRIIVEKLPD